MIRTEPHAQLGPLGGRQVSDVPAFQIDTAPGGLVLAGEHVEKGGLARTVGADDGLKGKGRHAEIDMVHGHMPAETDSQVPGFNNWGFDNGDGVIVGHSETFAAFYQVQQG